MKRPRLSKSGIEYLDYAWNFYSGCKNGENGICPIASNCWAKKITERFKNHYPGGFEPTFYPDAFLSPLSLKNPSWIGVCFMGDMFGDWVDPDKRFTLPETRSGWVDVVSLKSIIFQVIKACPQHTFLFLTKNPAGLVPWSPFPENCSVGVTVTDDSRMQGAYEGLDCIIAERYFLSIEPLLSPLSKVSLELIAKGYYNRWLDWLAIGALSGTKVDLLKLKSERPSLTLMPYGKIWTLQPEISWVQKIVEAADKAGAKVFLKENLRPLLYQERNGRQVLPKWAANSSGKLRQELPICL